MSQLFNKIPQFFYSPDGPVGGSPTNTPTPNMGKEDVIDFLGETDDNQETPEVIDLEPKGKGKTKETEKEENEETRQSDDETDDEEDDEDELAEIEKELEGPTEEQLELVTPVRRKEILAKYPNLFKDFPYLEKAYYREQQFTELLPTIDDAKVAVEKAETLDKFEQEIFGGNTETVLKAIKEENPKAFNKVVDNYLVALANVDERAYMHVLGNVTKHTIIAMVKEAKSSSNEALQNAAALLNQFVFGSTNFTPPQNLSREDPETEKGLTEVQKREQDLLRRQYEGVHSDLNTRVNNTLKNTIDANIDPKKSMSDYVRKNASKDALETLSTLMSKDQRFVGLVDKLWGKAAEENFSRESVERIRSAFVSKAKTLLPSVIKKARNEALRGTGKRVRDGEEDTTPSRGPVGTGRPRSTNQTSGKIKSAKDIPAGMSSLDFLNSD